MKTNPISRASLLATLPVVCLIILLVAFWIQRADLVRVRKAYGQLQEQNAGLQKNPSSSRAEPGPLAVAPAQAQTPEAVAPQPEAHPPAVERNRLALAGTEVTSTQGGLIATMRFSPSKTGPLGIVALAVRMPRNSTAKILDIGPVGSAVYDDSSKEVSADGKFAFFQGTLGDEKEVQLFLSVSGPTTASVRGTCGITPFELAIQVPPAKGRGKE